VPSENKDGVVADPLTGIFGFNSATWDRLRSAADNGDGLAVATLGILRVLAENAGFNGATWDRLRTLVDNADGSASGVVGLQGIVARIQGFNGASFDRVRVGGDNADGVAVLAAGSQLASSRDYVFNGATWDRFRTPNVFKPFATTAITAGTGATLWTPAAGKKFRLMGWLVSSSAAGQLIFGDNAVGTVIARSELLAAGAASKCATGDLGNGILSAAANNVLKIDGPTGNVAGMVWGTEE
jgi:hypothetical protein